MKCNSCYGRGYDESPHYYYGRAECPSCLGLGRVQENGEPYEEEEIELEDVNESPTQEPE